MHACNVIERRGIRRGRTAAAWRWKDGRRRVSVVSVITSAASNWVSRHTAPLSVPSHRLHVLQRSLSSPTPIFPPSLPRPSSPHTALSLSHIRTSRVPSHALPPLATPGTSWRPHGSKPSARFSKRPDGGQTLDPRRDSCGKDSSLHPRATRVLCSRPRGMWWFSYYSFCSERDSRDLESFSGFSGRRFPQL